MKKYLISLISDNETRTAINKLLELAQATNNEAFLLEVTLQSAKYNECIVNQREGTISYQEASQALAKINKSLLALIGYITEDGKIAYESHFSDERPGKTMTIVSPWKWLAGLGAIFIAITLFMKIYKNDILNSQSAPASPESNTVTVLVHGKKGKDQLVLPNRGIVKLIYGDAIVSKQINAEGEATFKQINDYYFNESGKVEILFIDPEGESYRAVNPDTFYQLKRGEYVPLEVRLEGVDKVMGIIKDFKTGAPIEGARISIQQEATFSNQHGEFLIVLPEPKQRSHQMIRASKEGYQDFKLSNVPILEGKEIPILLKPK
jgi:hypothetical protein